MRQKINIFVKRLDKYWLALIVYFVGLIIITEVIKQFRWLLLYVFDYIDILMLKVLLVFALQYFVFVGWLWLVFEKILKENLLKFIKSQLKRRWRKAVGFTIILYFLVMFLIGLIKFLIHKYWIYLPGFWEKEKVVDFVKILLTKGDVWVYILIFIIVVLAGPFVEEVIFRGFITKILIDKLGAFWWILLSGLIFWLAHMEWEVAGYLTILGIVLAYIWWRYQSLVYSFLFHMLINFFSFIAVLVAVLYWYNF
jgi:membrane protease YdiL (CAAX protease family)